MKGTGARILLAFLVVGIVFPTLIIAFLTAWRLLLRFSSVASVPDLVLRIASIVGLAGGVAAAAWCCWLIWRRATAATKPE